MISNAPYVLMEAAYLYVHHGQQTFTTENLNMALDQIVKEWPSYTPKQQWLLGGCPEKAVKLFPCVTKTPYIEAMLIDKKCKGLGMLKDENVLGALPRFHSTKFKCVYLRNDA